MEYSLDLEVLTKTLQQEIERLQIVNDDLADRLEEALQANAKMRALLNAKDIDHDH